MPEFNNPTTTLPYVEKGDRIMGGSPSEFANWLSENFFSRSLTYTELNTLVTNSALVPAMWYKITNATSNNIKLLVQAISVNKLSNFAYDVDNKLLYSYDLESNTAELINLENNVISDFLAKSFENTDGNKAFQINNDGSIALSKLTKGTTDNILYNTCGLYGKKVNILGDSISTPNGGNNTNQNYTYFALLESLLNCELYVNAVAGSCITSGGSGQVDFTDNTRWTTMNTNTPDVILIFGGINDFLQDITLGTLGDTDKTASFYGALDFLYKSILNANPMARVFHMTPLHTTFAQGGGLIPEFNGTNYLTEYVNAIFQVADRYGVGVINTNRNSGITCYNIATYASDLIHVNEIGHKKIFDTLINEIKILL